MYFPTKAESAYKCPTCGHWFIQGNKQCLVAHSPGTCCHYGDETIPEPRYIESHKERLWDKELTF